MIVHKVGLSQKLDQKYHDIKGKEAIIIGWSDVYKALPIP